MESNQKQTKYYAHIQGPILFTAPHSKNLYRGGPKYQLEYDVHPREKQTAFLAVDFAYQIMKYVDTKYHQGSFCVWGKNISLDYQDLDPNYLLEQLYQQSPFHQSLHEFISHHSKQTPLFHIDIHGKYDRKSNCELDVGIVSMEVLWKEGSMVGQIKNYMKPKFDKLFSGLKLGQFEPKCNTDPALSGYWGSKVATMTTQAIKLGIPSLQLQIPTKMRNLLASDDQIREGFVKIIAQTYNNIIVPLWSKKTFPLKLNENILGTLILSKFKEQDIINLREQLKQLQEANNKDEQA